MDFLYSISNASLVVRIMDYLAKNSPFSVKFVTVLHCFEYWVVRVSVADLFTYQDCCNFEAFLSELGVPYEPTTLSLKVLKSLENGMLPVEVMQRYKIAVVSHGTPNPVEVDVFRDSFIQGLGYCPCTCA